ncbi:MAG: hypothetical protein AAB380_04090 [Verrucomicrobiota bacterium]
MEPIADLLGGIAFGTAQQLLKNDPFQFQHWALSLVDARPLKEGDGQGADRGVDGLLDFYESKDERRKIIVSKAAA